MSSDVETWLLSLRHPQEAVIRAVRDRVLGADPAVREGIKWNAGSFRTTEWFATFHVTGPRGPRPVGLVLHLGAKRRAERGAVADPAGLLSPVGVDRAVISFADLPAVERAGGALEDLVRAWIVGL